MAAADDEGTIVLSYPPGEIKLQGDLISLDTNVMVMHILDAARTSAKTWRTIYLGSAV